MTNLAIDYLFIELNKFIKELDDLNEKPITVNADNLKTYIDSKFLLETKIDQFTKAIEILKSNINN